MRPHHRRLYEFKRYALRRRGVLSGRMRERLQDERRGFADHCRVDATGDRVHALPETTTRLAFAESRAADSPHAICDGSNRTQVPVDITCTSPHAKHRRYGARRSRPRRSRPASALPSKFRRKAPKTWPRIGRTAESRNSTGPFGERSMIGTYFYIGFCVTLCIIRMGRKVDKNPYTTTGDATSPRAHAAVFR